MQTLSSYSVLISTLILSSTVLFACASAPSSKTSASPPASPTPESQITPSSASPSPLPSATGCKTSIRDQNPPTNVRANPDATSENIVGTLQNGEVVTIVAQKNDWLQISAPVSGWVAVKLTTVSCTPVGGGLAETSSNIRQLGAQAIEGDRNAADTLVRYSLQADGAYADILSETLAQWAGQNPTLLVTVLDGQPVAIREQAIVLLDYGLNPKSQPAFEGVIATLPTDSPTRQAWQSRPRKGN